MMYIGSTRLDDGPPVTITDWRGSGSVSYGGLRLIWHRCVDITMAMVAEPETVRAPDAAHARMTDGPGACRPQAWRSLADDRVSLLTLGVHVVMVTVLLSACPRARPVHAYICVTRRTHMCHG